MCNADDVQDEQHIHSQCTHPHVRVVSLRTTYASLFPPTDFHNVCLLF